MGRVPIIIAAALFVGVAALLTPSPASAQEATSGAALGFYRFPALHDDFIVFAAEGDLWRVPVTGGVATRLTTHPAEETDPIISADGQTLAFTARYEGPAEVYTMPVNGGLPTRRTYEGEASIATTWTPSGELVYTTTHFATLPVPELAKLDLASGTTSRIPLATATEGNYDASGSTLFFVRPAFHRNVTKRYTGGTARDVWSFTEGADEAVELTGDYAGESHSPMSWEGRVYFVSDRDGTMNVFSMAEDGSGVRQHTFHSGWDVKEPSLSSGRIAYQLGADLWLYDIASTETSLVPITLASDFDQLREKWITNPMQYLTSAHIHPEGESVVLTARGRVFVAPAGEGRLVRASTKPGVRLRDVMFMPDGERLAGLSDETGELEWVTLPADGIGEERALTSNGAILRFQGTPSPDGERIAYMDNNRDFWILEVESGRHTLISENREGIRDGAWSSDGRWLAFTMTALNTFSQIKLYSVADGSTTALTSDRVNSFSPTWSPEGDFIYFLSDRNLRSLVGAPWGPRQPEPYFDKPIEVYEIALRPGLRSPFVPTDELTPASDESDGRSARREADSEDEASAVEIGLEGIARRLRRVPVAAGNYSSLSSTQDALFLMSRGSGPGASNNLAAIAKSAGDAELQAVVENARSYELAQNGKKMLVRRANDLFIINAQPRKPADLNDSKVDLSAWTFSIDVREDWRQIFVDAWRLERDWFYDPGMHGVDWDATLQKYLPLVDRVTTRGELSDLIGRVVGELSALHTSVRGGDTRAGDDNVRIASLGARLVRDPAAGGYRIDYIYQSDPDYPEEMSPLSDPSLNVHDGDVIQSVNGIEALAAADIGALLRNQANNPVRLGIRPAAGGDVHEVMVTPTTSERGLRYSDWEYTRRLRVDEDSDASIGYVHLRAMGGGNLTEWYRNFYPVFNRQGLIIDVRRNNGGNIDSFILEKLMRQAWMYWKDRAGEPSWNMQYAFRGHMVVLVDQNTASDGEAFADGFRRLGLGPLIGTRTWGGEIWLSSNNRLTDGGLARAPMMGVYGPEGEWLIEQVGVIPDMEVDNLPHATFNGEDAQLDAAIAYLLEEIRKDPRDVPAPPAYPNKGFRYRATDGSGASGSGGGR